MKDNLNDIAVTVVMLKEYGGLLTPMDREHIDEFGIRTEILNTRNYGTVINRFRNALERLYREDIVDRQKYGRGYVYTSSRIRGSLGKI